MTAIYLVTGFLGAGKTTFLKKFIKLFEKQKMHIIINEFGKEGIDGQLLKTVGTVLDEINNGSIFCSCRLDRFEEVLQNALSKQPEIIIIEASGLSNPTNVRKILDQPDKFNEVDYKGSICLVDAVNFLKVYHTATVVKKQISISDVVLINKIDLVEEEKLKEIETKVWEHRPDMLIYRTSYGEIQPEWIANIKRLTEEQGTAAKMQAKDITLRSYTLVIGETFSCYEFQKFVEMFMEDTYRIKGFVRLEGKVYLVDCVGTLFKMIAYDGEVEHINHVVILSAGSLPCKKSVETAISWYPDKVKSFVRG